MNNHSLQILIVDDDPLILNLLAKWLTAAGHQVCRAADGREAMRLIRESPPQVLITDWNMPEMDGLALCKTVRRINLPNYIYILFLTTRSEQNDTIDAFSAGADDFLVKPVTRAELFARLRSASRLLEREAKLNRLASIDPLTNVLNRRAFFQHCDREMSRAARYDHPVSCVLMDIDLFKRVNDIHGHVAGDAALVAVARLIANRTRASDYVCRYGGEEFCILLPETNESDAARWAEHVRAEIADTPLPIEGATVHVTASFGIAERLDDSTRPEDMLEWADQALHVAKEAGRDRVMRFGELERLGDLHMLESEGWRAVLHETTARDVMTAPIMNIQEDAPSLRVAEFLVRHRINSMPVVDANGRLVGIVSEKDLLVRLTNPDSLERPICEVMHKNVVAYDEETSCMHIHDFLSRVSIRRVVIVKDGKPTGIISRGTFLRWLGNWGIAGVVRKSTATPQEDAARRDTLRELAAEKAAELLDAAVQMQSTIAVEEADHVPTLVRGVAQIQELSIDLLTCCQTNYRYEPDASTTGESCTPPATSLAEEATP